MKSNFSIRKQQLIYIMERKIKLIFFILSLCFPMMAWAVTDKEMEEARVIATKAYLRYANDGSGYLDDINPKTMSELESALKPKEKENIKVFKAIANPVDYKKWDKQQLIEFWSVTAYQTKGLVEKGKLGKTRTKNLIGKMTIAAPAPAAPEKKENPSPATEPTEEAVKPVTDTMTASAVNLEAPDSLANIASALDASDALMDDDSVEKVNNYTWVYILALAILVAVVVALIVFASNVLNRNNSRGMGGKASEGGEEAEALKEHYSEQLAEKDQEIKVLSKKLENANRQNADLKMKLEALTAEVASLRSNRHDQTRDNAMRSAERRETNEHHSANAGEKPQSHPNPLRHIYLGRANSKGIFIRADRNLNPGNSIYLLNTKDGYTGTFRVADDPSVWQTAFKNPVEMLGHACSCHDITDTEGMTRIITESPGTAVFEGGCWKVIRKAKIRYE